MARSFVTGHKLIEKKFQKLIKRMDAKTLESIMFKSTLQLVKLMKRRAPKGETGTTAAAIGRRRVRGRKRISGKEKAAIYVGNTNRRKGWKAHFFEFGTVKMPARPYIRPSWERMKRSVNRNIAEGIRKVIFRPV